MINDFIFYFNKIPIKLNILAKIAGIDKIDCHAFYLCLGAVNLAYISFQVF